MILSLYFTQCTKRVSASPHLYNQSFEIEITKIQRNWAKGLKKLCRNLFCGFKQLLGLWQQDTDNRKSTQKKI